MKILIVLTIFTVSVVFAKNSLASSDNPRLQKHNNQEGNIGEGEVRHYVKRSTHEDGPPPSEHGFPRKQIAKRSAYEFPGNSPPSGGTPVGGPGSHPKQLVKRSAQETPQETMQMAQKAFPNITSAKSSAERTKRFARQQFDTDMLFKRFVKRSAQPDGPPEMMNGPPPPPPPHFKHGGPPGGMGRPQKDDDKDEE